MLETRLKRAKRLQLVCKWAETLNLLAIGILVLAYVYMLLVGNETCATEIMVAQFCLLGLEVVICLVWNRADFNCKVLKHKISAKNKENAWQIFCGNTSEN